MKPHDVIPAHEITFALRRGPRRVLLDGVWRTVRPLRRRGWWRRIMEATCSR